MARPRRDDPLATRAAARAACFAGRNAFSTGTETDELLLETVRTEFTDSIAVALAPATRKSQ